MAMEPSLRNLFYFTSITSPWLGWIFYGYDYYNQWKSKGLVYLGGVLIALLFNIVMKLMIKSPADPNRAKACDMLKFSYGLNYNNQL